MDEHTLEEALDWAEYWKSHAEERDELVGRLKDHAADQARQIDELRDELIESYRDTARFAELQARLLGG